MIDTLDLSMRGMISVKLVSTSTDSYTMYDRPTVWYCQTDDSAKIPNEVDIVGFPSGCPFHRHVRMCPNVRLIVNTASS